MGSKLIAFEILCQSRKNIRANVYLQEHITSSSNLEFNLQNHQMSAISERWLRGSPHFSSTKIIRNDYDNRVFNFQREYEDPECYYSKPPEINQVLNLIK